MQYEQPIPFTFALGSEVTFEEMIRNKQEKERYTSLCQRIEEMNEQ